MRTLSGSGITCSSLDESLASDAQMPQDSVSKRRRHAMYFHRPPVWRYSSFQDESSSPEMSEDLNGSDRVPEEDLWIGALKMANQDEFGAAPYVALNDSDSDHETPLLEDWASDRDMPPLDCRPSFTETIPDPFCQSKPVFCTRLHSYRDIRLGLGEQWAVQEGSLVIGIGPEYTLLDSHERDMDEFEVSSGDVFVVCSLYADLWALCAKVSFNASLDGDDALRIAFLPLCSVTLLPNYSAFVQRSATCAEYYGSHEDRYPGNGLPVMPPRRSHSLTASKQAFQGLDNPIPLPLAAQEAFRSLALRYIDDDFAPTFAAQDRIRNVTVEIS
ncbi:uncharacterized protein BDV17DRAFT_290307 [Aspergillus undulatus]|uniref:uncharacterized protein n=1 Tax=Aspergillus undulatus TaxID=1810928 RepID=UPI003CCC9ACD